nr:hypothetical protein [uncultured Psychroserpens sp.]
MKHLFLILCVICTVTYNISAQAILELKPSQSMSITGKGAGQDAAINPYAGSNSLAFIENIGENDFTIRVQNKKGNIIESIVIKPNETKEVRLLIRYELYLDSKLKSKAKVRFKKLNSY